MNMLDRTIVYSYKVPYQIRELLFKIRLFFFNKVPAFSIRKNLINDPTLLEELKENGLVFLKSKSCPNDSQTKSMVNHLEKVDKKNFYDQKASKISYETNDLAQHELFIKFSLDDDILCLVKNYFNAVPKIAFLKAWKVNSGTDDLPEMSFHMDHHGHRFLKVFWYLNDVEENFGHHEYIQKTHFQPEFDKYLKDAPDEVKEQIIKKRKLKGKYRIDNQILIDHFRNDLIKISGKEGSGFIEDTRGLHRGTEISQNTFRIIYQVLYVPYITDKDKNTHSRIRNKNAFEMFLRKNTKNHDLYKFIFSELL